MKKSEAKKALSGKSPREWISKERVGPLGFQGSEVGDPSRGVRDITEQRPGAQFNPCGNSHAASGRGYERPEVGAGLSTATE